MSATTTPTAAAASSSSSTSTSRPLTKKPRTKLHDDTAPVTDADNPYESDAEEEQEEIDGTEEKIKMGGGGDSSDSDDPSSSSSDSDSSDSDSDSGAVVSSSPATTTKPQRTLLFRNYTPHDSTLRVSRAPPIDLEKDNAWLDSELKDVIDAAMKKDGEDDQVLLSITPKPLNWDLRRDLQPAMDELNKRTQAKIREIIQKQVEEQKKEQMEESSSDSSDSEDEQEEKQ